MSNIYTQNFDGVTPPALPGGFTATTGAGVATWTTVTTPHNSSPNSLSGAFTGSGLAYYWGSGTSDSGGGGTLGDDSFTAALQISGSGTRTVGCMVRMKGDPTVNANTYYRAVIVQNAGLQLFWRNTSGTSSQIGSTVGTSSTFAINAWYILTVKAVGTTISAQVQRVSDSMWLDNTGTWQASQLDAINQTDSNIANGSTSFGGVYAQTTSAVSFFVDDISFDTASASGPATGISITPSGSTTGTFNVSQNFTLALSPPGSTSAGVTVTLHDSLAATIGSPVTLTTGAPSQIISLTPTVTGSHSVTVTNNQSLTNPSAVTVAVSYATINPGIITPNLSLITASQIVLDNTGATGNAALTYQWQEALDPNGAFTNAGTNSTRLTRTGVGVASTRFYQTVVSDGLAANQTTTVQPGATFNNQVVLGCAGDSIMQYDEIDVASPVDWGPNSTGTLFGSYVNSMLGTYNIPSMYITGGSPPGSNSTNYGRAGTSTGNWVGSGSMVGCAVAWAAVNVTHGILMLGANDAKNIAANYATYKSNIFTILTYLFANVPTLQKMVVFPPYMWASFANSTNFTSPATLQTANSFILSCNPIGADAAAAFPGKVRNGGLALFQFMANSPYANYDAQGIHPSAISAPDIAQVWAGDFVEQIFGSVVNITGGAPGVISASGSYY